MNIFSGAVAWCLAGLVIIAALFMLRRPLSCLFRLFLRSGAGLTALALLAPAGQVIGVSLGVNLFNALILGLLGIPGLGLLLMMQWILK